MTTTSKIALMIALNSVTRPVPGAEKEKGVPLPTESIPAGKPFRPEDAAQRDELLAHGAARDANKDEITVYEAEIKARGGEEEGSEIVASVPAKARRGGAGKPKAEKAGTDPAKAGGDPLL